MNEMHHKTHKNETIKPSSAYCYLCPVEKIYTYYSPL